MPKSISLRVMRWWTSAGMLVLSFAAAAGPWLDEALEASQRDIAVPSPTTLAPHEGLETPLAGPWGDAPWLVPGGSASRFSAHLVSSTQAYGALRWRAGFAWREGPQPAWCLDGSMIGWSLGGSELYASVERRHWGPGWMGSLILDGSAPALPAIGWRTTQAAPSRGWRWLGSWTADVFMAQLQGHSEPAHPLLVGMRLQFEPSRTLRVGLSRTLQWGGAGRDESLRSLLRGLLGRDNPGSRGVGRTNEPGNQLAGVDWRWSPDLASLPSFYGQKVGEDEAGMLPSKSMLLLGVDMPVKIRGGSLRVFAEAADTIAGQIGGNSAPGAAYRHHAFAQGYTQFGVPLGHPAGGDVRLFSTGALFQRGSVGAMAALSVGRAEATAQRFAAGRFGGLNVAAHVDVGHRERVGSGLWWWHDAGGSRGEAQLWWQHRY